MGVYDLYMVKRQMFVSAAVISSQLLLVDEIMKAGHDCYLTPEEAIKMGIVDGYIGDDSISAMTSEKKKSKRAK